MRQNDYAVVVGIAHYPLFHADLGGPVNDAKHFVEWLITTEDQAPGSGEFQDPAFEGDDDWVFAQVASKQAPTATVQIDFGQLSLETNVELIDASHNSIEKHMPKDGPWQTYLQSGFYLLQVPATWQRKFFDVTGSDLITISLEDRVVQENREDATGKVHLVVEAGDPTTEIFVIDSHFQRVMEGVTGGHGHREVDLDPGIYKIKFAAGFLIQEEYVALQAGSGPVIVTVPDLHFSAAAPIKETSTTQDYHEENANKVSKRIHCEIGSSSWNILVNASVAHPKIVRAGSLASYVADRIWGNGTWLVWQGSSTDTPNLQLIEQLDVSTLHFVYPQIVTILAALGNKPIVDFVKEHSLSNLERFLLEYIDLSILPMVAGQAPDEEQLRAWVRENLTAEKLVQALHVPSVAIGEATADLVKKLKLKTF